MRILQPSTHSTIIFEGFEREKVLMDEEAQVLNLPAENFRSHRLANVDGLLVCTSTKKSEDASHGHDILESIPNFKNLQEL